MVGLSYPEAAAETGEAVTMGRKWEEVAVSCIGAVFLTDEDWLRTDRGGDAASNPSSVKRVLLGLPVVADAACRSFMYFCTRAEGCVVVAVADNACLSSAAVASRASCCTGLSFAAPSPNTSVVITVVVVSAATIGGNRAGLPADAATDGGVCERGGGEASERPAGTEWATGDGEGVGSAATRGCSDATERVSMLATGGWDAGGADEYECVVAVRVVVTCCNCGCGCGGGGAAAATVSTTSNSTLVLETGLSRRTLGGVTGAGGARLIVGGVARRGRGGGGGGGVGGAGGTSVCTAVLTSLTELAADGSGARAGGVKRGPAWSVTYTMSSRCGGGERRDGRTSRGWGWWCRCTAPGGGSCAGWMPGCGYAGCGRGVSAEGVAAGVGGAAAAAAGAAPSGTPHTSTSAAPRPLRGGRRTGAARVAAAAEPSPSASAAEGGRALLRPTVTDATALGFTAGLGTSSVTGSDQTMPRGPYPRLSVKCRPVLAVLEGPGSTCCSAGLGTTAARGTGSKTGRTPSEQGWGGVRWVARDA